MASIDKRPHGRYRARWREFPGGPQKTRHFDRRLEAQRFLDTVRGDLARGVYIDPAGGRTLFREYAEQWRAAQVHRPSTAQQAETYLRVHAYPTLGHRPLGMIRRSEVQAWVKDRSAVLSPGSVEVVYRWVATIFRAAVSDRLIPASPCDRIGLPKRERHEVVPLTVEAVEALVHAMPDRYRALIVFAAGTGLRQGECFGRRWIVSTSCAAKSGWTASSPVCATRSPSSAHPRATPGTGPSPCRPPWSTPSRRTSLAFRSAATTSASPTCGARRCGVAPLVTCGDGLRRRRSFPPARPSTTSATSTPRS